MDIYEASREGNEKRVADLIAQGIDVNKPDRDGFTPLHHAGQSGSPKIYELLLKSGANPNARDLGGRTPMFKIEFGSRHSYTIIANLIGHGADLDVKDDDDYLAGQSWEGYQDDMILTFYARSLLKAADLEVTTDSLLDVMDILTVNDDYRWVVGYDNDRIPNREGFFKAEVARLKSTHLTNSITYFDLLHIDLFQHLQNESLRALIKTLDLKNFPEYKFLIKKKYNNAGRKLKLLRICVKCFTGFLEMRCDFGVMLPEELTRRILLYLSERELKLLIDSLSEILGISDQTKPKKTFGWKNTADLIDFLSSNTFDLHLDSDSLSSPDGEYEEPW